MGEPNYERMQRNARLEPYYEMMQTWNYNNYFLYTCLYQLYVWKEITISIDINVIRFAWHLNDPKLGLGGKEGKIIYKKTKLTNPCGDLAYH